jgi:hypothetical protein
METRSEGFYIFINLLLRSFVYRCKSHYVEKSSFLVELDFHHSSISSSEYRQAIDIFQT